MAGIQNEMITSKRLQDFFKVEKHLCVKRQTQVSRDTLAALADTDSKSSLRGSRREPQTVKPPLYQ